MRKNISGTSPTPPINPSLTGIMGKFQISMGSETLEMTFEGLGEMFEGDSADTCIGKLTEFFPVLLSPLVTLFPEAFSGFVSVIIRNPLFAPEF